MGAIRVVGPALMLLAVAGCNSTSSGQWRPISSSYEGRFEQAQAICNGRAAETQVLAGRRWIAGAIAADTSFKGCMAQQGFVMK